MGAESQGSRSEGGGYVGGFLQFFDWNAKSRKKLLSSKSDLRERSKQKKISNENLSATQIHLMDEDEIVAGTSIKGSSDYSCSSSVTDDEIFGAKAPSVVARLMGLDSLPTSNFPEPSSTPFFDSQSLQDAHDNRRKFEFYHDDQVVQSRSQHTKVDIPVRNAIEPGPQKVIHKPIDKFQTEILPRKSAKLIPITQHKLLSPIKSPSFTTLKNSAHIMEAAAKIIDPGPRTTTKRKMPLVSPSVALKVRDLKEKADTAQKPSKLAEPSQRPFESNAAKYLKGQSMNKSWNGSADAILFRVSSDVEECSADLRNKGKSISLAVQAKVNVQKREGLNLGSNISSLKQKEQRKDMSSQLFKSQPSTQKGAQKSMLKKSSALNAPNVLRQNNQKQNCLADKGKSPAKPLVSANSKGRKFPTGDSSIVRKKCSIKCEGNSKGGARKFRVEETDGEKESSHPSTKNVIRKKRSMDDNCHFERSQIVNNVLVDENDRPIHCNAQLDGKSSWAEDNRGKGIDIVSFTFTAPLTRPIAGPETSKMVVEKNTSFSVDYQNKRPLLNSDGVSSSRLSSPGYNIVGGDALSTLLEHNLSELGDGLEYSSHNSGPAGSSALIFQNFVPASRQVTTIPMLLEERSQGGIHKDNLADKYSVGFSSTDPQLAGKHNSQVVDYPYGCGSTDMDARKLHNHQHLSPMSVLEPSYFTESCKSSDVTDNCNRQGSKQCSSVPAQAMLDRSSSRKFQLMEADAELLDSASSISSTTVAAKHISVMKDFERTTKWELAYVNQTLCNIELMFKDFALGRARDIINPHLFDQLESRKGMIERNGDELKLTRKVLFDCVSECLDLRCRQYAGGGCRTWAKGLSIVRRKEWLAMEVYREISSWEGMGDCMVDELIDKDMSSQYGRWLDFEVETFELGVEIEGRLLNFLLDEVVADILPL